MLHSTWDSSDGIILLPWPCLDGRSPGGVGAALIFQDAALQGHRAVIIEKRQTSFGFDIKILLLRTHRFRVIVDRGAAWLEAQHT